MAKTYNLKAEGTFTITDNNGLVIQNLIDSHTFSTITSDTIQSGVISIVSGASEQLNIKPIGNRTILFCKNNNTSTGTIRLSIDDGSTAIISLSPQEWCFVPLDKPSPNMDVFALAADADGSLTYLLIEQ
jgi:hypothetical protein